MKGSYKIFIYILVICGAILMLLPFAWMVDTSFKASSEVSTWPPQWTTKNAAASYPFKTNIQKKSSGSGIDLSSLSLSEFKNFSALLSERTGDNTLVLELDDDPIRRGEIEILVLNEEQNPALFSNSITDENKELFLNEFYDYTKIPEEYYIINEIDFQNIESFLDEYFDLSEYSSVGFARRIIFVSEIDGLLNKLQKTIESSIYNPFKELPIDSDETVNLKKEIKNKLTKQTSDLQEMITSTKEQILDYRKGEKNVLSEQEFNEFLGLLTVIDEKITVSFTDIFTYLETVIPEDDKFLNLALGQFEKVYSSNLENSVYEWENLINQYLLVKNFYFEQQIQQIEGIEIVGRIRTNDEVYRSLLSKIEIWDIPDDIKKEIEKRINANNILDSNNIFLDLVDGIVIENIKKLDENYRDIFSSVNEKINLIKSSIYLLENDELKEEIEKFFIEKGGYSEFKNLLTSLSKETGQSFVYGQIFNEFDTLTSSLGSTAFMDLIFERWEQIEWVGRFSKLFSDSLSELDLTQKPAEIDKVYYRGRLSDLNKSFEIVFNDISAVWFKDDTSYGRVNFNAGEVFLNFWQNYVDAWNAAPFGRYYLNTVFVAVTTTVLEIIFAAMAAFAFAKMEFFGKKFIFSLFLATMMVPGEVLLVPNFITLTNLGWVDTYYALIVPWVVSVFAIFLLRQHFMTIPDELYDAAKIDGMNKWKFLWGVMVPLSKPAIITGALLKFVGSWNSFLWVLIITKSPEYRTLPVGLQNFSSATGTEYNLLMSAATFSIIPVVVLFLVTQKYFIAGISRSGLK